jgi:alginate O-acetyltransferase complex protein AlgI
MPDLMIERRLQPHMGELYEWTFHRFAQQCEQHGIHPLVVYRPEPVDFEGRDQAGRSEVTSLARAAGLEVIDLSPAFDSVTDRNTLMLAKWDHHTTAFGHRLLAGKLYDRLVPLLFGPSNQNAPAPSQSPARF